MAATQVPRLSRLSHAPTLRLTVHVAPLDASATGSRAASGDPIDPRADSALLSIGGFMPELLSNPSVLLRPAAGSPEAAALIDRPGARFRSRLSEFHLARPSEQLAVTGLALLA